MISKAASMSLEELGIKYLQTDPESIDAISASIISTQPVGCRIDKKTDRKRRWDSSRSSSRRFAVNADVRMQRPVTLPPGRPKLA